MKKQFQLVIRDYVRQLHATNIAISAKGDPAVDTGLRFASGFKSNGQAPADVGRRMRRAMERQTMKQLARK